LKSALKRYLHAKYWLGLNNYQPVDLTNLYNDLNKPWAEILRKKLYENAVTVVNNENNLLPLTQLDSKKIATVNIGLKNKVQNFKNVASKYAPITFFDIENELDADKFNELENSLSEFSTIIINIHGVTSSRSKNWGISWRSTHFIKKLEEKAEVIVVVYGNPYSLKLFEKTENVLCVYEDNEITQKAAAQAIFGAMTVKGTLPITASPKLQAGIGFATSNIGRIRVGRPEEVSMSSKKLQMIDSIALDAIKVGATPGCQVLVLKDSILVYNKSFGHLSYDKKNPVTDQTVYDIASITKVAATTLATMFLVEQGLINIEKTASEYLPELHKTDKRHTIIKDILLHQAGLQPYLDHWRRTKDGKMLSEAFYCNLPDDRFSLQVVPGIYALKSMEDSLWKWSINSPLLPIDTVTCTFPYKYSDIGFYIMKRICEKILNQSIDEFLQHNFYNPLGTSNLGFNVYCKIPTELIAPTENDEYFRNTLVCGNVHDQGAAMQGGVAGHAGLFSNATDLGILMQMFLQKGYYGGNMYLREQTIFNFTKRDLGKGRRGLGWDKPILGDVNNTSKYSSPSTYGHTGFTGTAVWVDPKYNLVYVFLSNRVHPNAENKKLITLDVRTKIHDVIYESITGLVKQKINWKALECDYIEPMPVKIIPKAKPVNKKAIKKKKKR
jgi:beta-N-acetylhexosaminidase